MSAPPPPVLLTAAAEADLEDIRAYTEATWGEAQWLAYFAAIGECFDRIAAFPQSGRGRGDFTPGLRSVRCREHVVFYLPEVRGAVVVQRILHAKQNAEALAWSERMGG